MFQKTNLLRALPAIILSTLLAVLVIYAWSEPTSPPPSGNVSVPLNVGSVGQDKSGALRIGGVFQTDDAAFLARYGGNVGIGTTGPGAKLEVNGGIKITSGSGGAITFSDGSVQASAAGDGVTKRTLPAPSYNQWTDEPNIRDASAATSGYYSRSYCGQSYGPESYNVIYDLGGIPRPVYVSLTGEMSASSYFGGSNAFSASLIVSVSNDGVTYTDLPSTYTVTEWYMVGIAKKYSVGIPANSGSTWARYIKVRGTFSKNCCENSCQTLTTRVYDLSIYY